VKNELEASGNIPLPHFTLLAYTGGLVKIRNLPLPLVVDMNGVDIPSLKIPVRYEHKSFQGSVIRKRLLLSVQKLLRKA
jgi:hypothetical protein